MYILLFRKKNRNKESFYTQLILFLILLLFILMFGTYDLYAQTVTKYSFSQNTAIYTPLGSKAAVLGACISPDPASSSEVASLDDHVFTGNPLPFSFNFDGQSYNSFDLCTNGWIAFGGANINASRDALSTDVGNEAIIAPFAMNLMGVSNASGVVTQGSNVVTNVSNTSYAKVGSPFRAGSNFPAGTTIVAVSSSDITVSNNAISGSGTAQMIQWALGEIKTEVTGSAPNRLFTIEFSGFSEYSNTTVLTSNINFQIILHEGGGMHQNQAVDIIYGDMYRSSGSITVQVGIRSGGARLKDVNNRTTATDWFNTLAGPGNTATCTWNTTAFPTNGLQYTWSPAVCSGIREVVFSNVNPTTATFDVSWTSSSSSPSNGYDYYISNSNIPPSAFVSSGSTLPGDTSETPTFSIGSLNYFWVRANCGTDVSPWGMAYLVPPANDNCGQATVLVQSASCNATSGTTAGATQSLIATSCNGSPDDDVWYSFVANTTDVQISLSNVNAAVFGSNTDAYFQVLGGGASGVCAATMPSLLCNDPNTGIVTGLIVGNTYFIRVYTNAVGAAINFNICVTDVPASSCPTLTTPSANAVASVTPTLIWAVAAGATSYDIYLDGSNPPTTLLASVNAPTTSYTIGSPLSPGDYYWYIIPRSGSGALSTCSSNISKFSVVLQPANDDCTNAVPLVQNMSCNATSGTTAGATRTPMANTCVGDPDDDVWYSFVANTTDVQVRLTNIKAAFSNNTGAVFQVLGGGASGVCSATMPNLLCSSVNTGIVTGLTVGNTYFIRVYTYTAGAAINFDICVTDVPAPSCPTLSTPSVNALVSTTPTLFWAAAAGAGSYDIYLDGSNPPTTLFATTNAPTTSYTLTSALAPGDYYWYIVAKNATGMSTTCASNTRKFSTIINPTNDDCTNAIVITQGANCNVTAGTTAGATQSMAKTCSGSGVPDDDVWYAFVATSNDASISLYNVKPVSGTSNAYGHFQVFDGGGVSNTCSGTMSSLICGNISTGGLNTEIVGGLVIGNTYYIRVYSTGVSDAINFDICVTNPLIPYCTSLSFPTSNAVISATPKLTWIASTGATSYDIYLDGNNPPTTLFTTVNGGSATSYPITTPLAAGSYYWYVVPKNSTGAPANCASSNTYKFSVVAPPANDDCSGAVALTQSASCNVVPGTTAGATQSMAAQPCTGTPDDDVWYSFVATGTDAQVRLTNVTTATGVNTYAYFQVLDGGVSGVCSNSMSSLLCSSLNTAIVGGLVIGNTYYIRVYSPTANAAINFDICVTATPSPLKIELEHIKATNIGAANRLDWNTVAEDYGDTFELQRSVDGKEYDYVSTIAANGVPSQYSYTDNAAIVGENYYRLRIWGYGGDITFSPVVTAVVNSVATNFSIEAVPNPVSHLLTIRVNSNRNRNAKVEVIDAVGRMVRSNEMGNSNEVVIDMHQLANGIYLVRYSDAAVTKVIKINKQ